MGHQKGHRKGDRNIGTPERTPEILGHQKGHQKYWDTRKDTRNIGTPERTPEYWDTRKDTGILKETYDKMFQRIFKDGAGMRPGVTLQQKQFAEKIAHKIAMREYIQN